MASDDGFREIQLNGKQLVFLFMATTIIAVVIFLCGVMVGRGVRNATTTAGVEPAASVSAATDLAAVSDTQGAGKAAAAVPPPTAMPPTPPAEDLSSEARPGSNKAPAGTPRQTPAPAAEKPGAGGASAQKGAAPPASASAASGLATAVPSEPPGEGLVVQVAALSEKSQAEAIVKRLVSKGYAAYLVPPSATGGMFRVRVGKFKERREAEAVVRRLEKEEQFKPWITR
jgi:cell division septation protein DedD